MRLLLLFVAFIWILMLLRTIVKAALQILLGQARANTASPKDEKSANEAYRLVRDPECGVYIRQDRALPLTSGAGTVHFCSTTCRDRYFARQQKLAASA